MRIRDLLLSNISSDYSENTFKEGSIFKAEILEILEDFILLDVRGQKPIKASSDIDLKSLVGKEISFLVKSNENGKMELKPLIKEGLVSESLGEESKDSIRKILNNFNIKETELSLDLVESLMEYKVPVSEENVLEAIKTLEKLVELRSLDEEDKVVLFEKENLAETKLEKEPAYIKQESTEALEDEIIRISEKTNVKNLLIVDKNSYPEKEDLSNIIKSILGNKVNFEEKELNKIISFFIKKDIKTSLSNIKNFESLSKNPIEFAKVFDKLSELLSELDGKVSFNKLKDLPSQIQLKRGNIEEASENIKELKEVLEESSLKLQNSSNIKKEINEIENKLDFLKEMDQDLSLVFIPINYGEKELDGVLTLLKENKGKENPEDKLNVFINLNTNNLGNIKISCQASRNLLSIKIKIKESDINLFESTKESLINKIESTGYLVDKIDFIVEKSMTLVDTIASNPNPVYFLDVKV